MSDISDWESEGGACYNRSYEDLTLAQKVGILYRLAYATYPQISYSEMDGGIFWKSLTQHKEGDTIEHEGKTYRVIYDGWAWMNYGPTIIYGSELEEVK